MQCIKKSKTIVERAIETLIQYFPIKKPSSDQIVTKNMWLYAIILHKKRNYN